MNPKRSVWTVLDTWYVWTVRLARRVAHFYREWIARQARHLALRRWLRPARPMANIEGDLLKTIYIYIDIYYVGMSNMHMSAHIWKHTYMHACTHAWMHACTNACIHAYIYMYICINI